MATLPTTSSTTTLYSTFHALCDEIKPATGTGGVLLTVRIDRLRATMNQLSLFGKFSTEEEPCKSLPDSIKSAAVFKCNVEYVAFTVEKLEEAHKQRTSLLELIAIIAALALTLGIASAYFLPPSTSCWIGLGVVVTLRGLSWVIGLDKAHQELLTAEETYLKAEATFFNELNTLQIAVNSYDLSSLGTSEAEKNLKAHLIFMKTFFADPKKQT